jgi:hypothetical protein
MRGTTDNADQPGQLALDLDASPPKV